MGADLALTSGDLWVRLDGGPVGDRPIDRLVGFQGIRTVFDTDDRERAPGGIQGQVVKSTGSRDQGIHPPGVPQVPSCWSAAMLGKRLYRRPRLHGGPATLSGRHLRSRVDCSSAHPLGSKAVPTEESSTIGAAVDPEFMEKGPT
jgi:hypothetical protein